MDRYEMTRRFNLTVQKDKVRKIDNVSALQQVCCELMDHNFHLRECLRQSVAREIPKKSRL